MLRFFEFVNKSLLENEVYSVFWKCNETIKLSPFTFLENLQLYAKLHVVYMKIIL